MKNTEMIKRISALAERDPRYRREAYFFMLASLEYTLEQIQTVRHLSGQELSRGIAEYARHQYGWLARPVLEHWGIRSTSDFGEIVYLLIDEGLMSKTEEDRREDFDNVYDFETEFSWENSKPSRFPERFE